MTADISTSDRSRVQVCSGVIRYAYSQRFFQRDFSRGHRCEREGHLKPLKYDEHRGVSYNVFIQKNMKEHVIMNSFGNPNWRLLINKPT